MRSFLYWVVSVFLCFSVGAHAADTEPLPPQEAFKLAPPSYDGKALILTYTIAPGYYMYGNRFKFELAPNVALGSPELPPGHPKEDPYIGKTEIYRDSLRIRIPVLAPINPAATTLIARSQGCADIGICYPPYTWKLPISTGSQAESATTPSKSGLMDEFLGKKKSPPLANNQSNQGVLGQLLAGHHWWLIILTFGALGLGLSLTACLFPLIPIVSGIIITSGTSRRRAFWLSFTYAQGVAITYAIAGLVAGLTGTLITQVLQTPWVIAGVGVIFTLLALSMFGLFQLQLPSALQSRLAASANQLSGGRVATVFLMGVLSSIIIGPCMAPPLAAALLYIGQTGDAFSGGLALYSLGVGLGIPLVFVGVFGASLLPHAGPWMTTVRRFYGVILLALALWMLQPLLSTSVLMLAWAALSIGCAIFLHALDPLPVNAHATKRLGKALGFILLLIGSALLIGCLSGNRDLFQPLKGSFSSIANASTPTSAAIPKNRVTAPTELQQALKMAQGHWAVVDVYADWCVSCQELEHETFTDPQVKKRFTKGQLIQFDITLGTPEQRQWLKEQQIFGPPALLLIDPQGQLKQTLIGFQSPEQLLTALKEFP